MITEILTVLDFVQGAGVQEEGVPVRRIWLPQGDRGTRKLVRIMGEQARGALLNPLTVQVAGDIMDSATPAPEQVGALRDWLSAYVRYMPDPEGTELLKSPPLMLEEIAARGEARGDCDDVATLAAALGLAAGHPARFVLFGFNSPIAPFSHVFAELYTICQGWIELDVTRPAQFPAGLEVARSDTIEV